MIGTGLAVTLAALVSASVVLILHRGLDGALLADREASVLVLVGLLWEHFLLCAYCFSSSPVLYGSSALLGEVSQVRLWLLSSG